MHSRSHPPSLQMRTGPGVEPLRVASAESVGKVKFRFRCSGASWAIDDELDTANHGQSHGQGGCKLK